MLNSQVSKILSVRNLQLRFSDNIVLNNLSLDINQGETISIIGRSGCGKTTLLRSLIFLELFSQGSYQLDNILIDSKELTKYQITGKSFSKNFNDHSDLLSNAELKKKVYTIRKIIGFLFQSYNLFPHLTVLENLKLALKLSLKLTDNLANEKSIKILNKFGIVAFKDRYPNQLSGGQQQRVAICRALVLEPKIMLYDEPTSALDPELVKDVIDIMNMLKQDGMTQVIVTHALGLARAVSDKIYYMENGEFIEAATPDDLLSRPKDARTIKYLNKIIIE
ncbi:MAG TPA: amino acid ABC transporter ATP-binding protein [Candidatus Kapabacteria bacterium]|nr:amino acid ABC transporter ATP-binding protein [Candidatus Kapabacteria bacterium]